MLRFITIALLLLLCTAPNFFLEQLYVVEAVNEEIVTLEALALNDGTESPLVIHTSIAQLSAAKEGQVFSASFAGNYLLKLELEEEITAERKAVIADLLNMLQQD